MKTNVTFDHTKSGIDSCGITPERREEIDKFMKHLVKKASRLKYKRSEVVEQIVDFAKNEVEAAVMASFLGTERVEQHNIVIRGEAPPGLRDLLEKLTDHITGLDKGPGMSVNSDGQLN